MFVMFRAALAASEKAKRSQKSRTLDMSVAPGISKSSALVLGLLSRIIIHKAHMIRSGE
jgi:hypothetical protein